MSRTSRTILSHCFRQLQGGQSPQLPAFFFHANSRGFFRLLLSCAFSTNQHNFVTTTSCVSFMKFGVSIWSGEIDQIATVLLPNKQNNKTRFAFLYYHLSHWPAIFRLHLESGWSLRPFTLTRLLELHDENNICNTNIGPREKKIIRTTFCCFAKKV